MSLILCQIKPVGILTGDRKAMILSSADILRVLGGSEIIRLSAKLRIVDGKPPLSGEEGLFIYIDRFPRVDEFQATWILYVESDGSEPDDIVLTEIKRLLPSVRIKRGLVTTVTTTDFLSENTQKAPSTPEPTKAKVDQAHYEERFQNLVEDVRDQMLLVSSGRPGKDGLDGRDGLDGKDGRDISASETDLEDLRNVEQRIPKRDGQVLTWKDGAWQNLFIPQQQKVSGGSSRSEGGSAIDEHVEVFSVADQNPVGLDNPLQLQVDTSYTGVSFDVATGGVLTLKKPGLFDVRLSMSLGRSSNAGDSYIIVRGELDPGGAAPQGWTQFTQARAFELDNNKAIVPVLFNAIFNIPTVGPVPPKVRAVIYRDSIGVDDGGVISVTSTLYGATASLSMNILHSR